MFSYYGTKKRIAHIYPKPQYDIIIEPFAGAAAYSMLYPEKQVILYDTNPKIFLIWDYLIKANKKEILNLPNIETKQKVTDFNLSDAEKYLIGFCINRGSSNPKITATTRNSWNKYKIEIANNVEKIKHWKIFNESYENIPNQIATWHIDPPYQKAGKYYFGHNKMNYENLSKFCKERLGQVMVCENEGADYLPFTFLTDHYGSIQKNTEVIWIN
jgi:site-specific DNA-adenine methylase